MTDGRDPGLAGERTALARGRTALAFVAVAASAVRAGTAGHLARLLAAAVLVGVVLAVARRRRRPDRLWWTSATTVGLGLVVLTAVLP